MIALLVPLRPQREQEQRRPEAALPLLCWLPPRPRRRPRQSAAASPRRPRPGSAEPRRRSCRATGGGADAGGGRERRGEDEEARRSPLPLEQRKADEARPQRLSAPWLSPSSSLPLGPPLPQRLRETAAAAAASLRPPREPAAAEAAAPAAAAAGRARQAPQPPRRRRCSRLPRVARRRSLPCPPCCSTKGPVALRGRSTRAAPRRRRRGRLRFGGSFGGKEGFVRVREREKEGERDEKRRRCCCRCRSGSSKKTSTMPFAPDFQLSRLSLSCQGFLLLIPVSEDLTWRDFLLRPGRRSSRARRSRRLVREVMM